MPSYRVCHGASICSRGGCCAYARTGLLVQRVTPKGAIHCTALGAVPQVTPGCTIASAGFYNWGHANIGAPGLAATPFSKQAKICVQSSFSFEFELTLLFLLCPVEKKRKSRRLKNSGSLLRPFFGFLPLSFSFIFSGIPLAHPFDRVFGTDSMS